jgi:hypothetical protein
MIWPCGFINGLSTRPSPVAVLLTVHGFPLHLYFLFESNKNKMMKYPHPDYDYNILGRKKKWK